MGSGIAVIPIPSALLACPFLVMGKPSKQVAIAEDDPGIPMSTAEMNVPETPPIQMASSSTKDVSVERPKVTGSKRAMPRVAESPGMAPNTIPRETIATISSRLAGCRQTINALTYSDIYPTARSRRVLEKEIRPVYGLLRQLTTPPWAVPLSP